MFMSWMNCLWNVIVWVLSFWYVCLCVVNSVVIVVDMLLVFVGSNVVIGINVLVLVWLIVELIVVRFFVVVLINVGVMIICDVYIFWLLLLYGEFI